MKKYLFAFIILTQLTHSIQAHAGAAGTMASEPTQILNNIELGFVAGSDLTTSISTTLDMTQNTILDPIANSLITNALNSASNDILSWVNGGFSGGAPLIIGNPQKYIEGKGLGVVKSALNSIPTNSVFGDSIFNSVLNSYKGSNDLPNQIKSFTQSNLPGIVRNDMCSDAKLTELAKQSVNDPNDTQEVAARKTQLYNYACIGGANDPQTSARLMDLRKQNPNLGSWDAMLATAGGDSDAIRAMRAREFVEQKKVAEEELTSKKIFDGEGPVSKTECTKYADVTDPYEEPQCLESNTLTPGKTVNALASKAVTAGADRLTSISGAGTLGQMLSNLAGAALTNGINKSLSSLTGGAQVVNTAVTLATSRPVVQDLTNDPDRKRELRNTMEKQFSYYSASLDKLESTDRSYLYDISSYEGTIQSGKACFDGLVQIGLITTDHYAFNFYASRQSSINVTRNSINQELNKIAQARQLVITTSSQLNASNSSSEIGTIFNNYLAAVDNQGLPNMQSQPTRNGEYLTNKSNINRDTDVTELQKVCAKIRQDSQTTVGGSFGF